MTVLFTDTQVEDLLDHLEDLVATIRVQHRELRARQLSDRDGYSQSCATGGGRGGRRVRVHHLTRAVWYKRIRVSNG